MLSAAVGGAFDDHGNFDTHAKRLLKQIKRILAKQPKKQRGSTEDSWSVVKWEKDISPEVIIKDILERLFGIYQRYAHLQEMPKCNGPNLTGPEKASLLQGFRMLKARLFCGPSGSPDDSSECQGVKQQRPIDKHCEAVIEEIQKADLTKKMLLPIICSSGCSELMIEATGHSHQQATENKCLCSLTLPLWFHSIPVTSCMLYNVDSTWPLAWIWSMRMVHWQQG